MLDKKKKDRIIEKFKTHKNDTGSPEVQIAILSAEVKELTLHLKTHKKDFSSRRGLIKKVSQRRRLLHYLQREDEKSYENVVASLHIKRRAEHTRAPEDETAISEESTQAPASDSEEEAEA
ncbi:30S ribosomal protein S15 [bacterium CG10_46_32]|nr:MAG: 30S ribosomal protein S15 [bacterium CG10_46_32]PIR55881.1 MAG: 30S ribosomal protein S15 [Parcubacteria group bacterium CG10_big_fil_rev_8_21_14_0_10_46_32]